MVDVWVAARQGAHPSATTAKPRPCSFGSCRLDGGVESQQVGLFSDAADDVEDLADRVRLLAHRSIASAPERTSSARLRMAVTVACTID